MKSISLRGGRGEVVDDPSQKEVAAGWGVDAAEKGEVDSNEKMRSLGPLIMSLEEEVLTLMATAGGQLTLGATAGGGSLT